MIRCLCQGKRLNYQASSPEFSHMQDSILKQTVNLLKAFLFLFQFGLCDAPLRWLFLLYYISEFLQGSIRKGAINSVDLISQQQVADLHSQSDASPHKHAFQTFPGQSIHHSLTGCGKPQYWPISITQASQDFAGNTKNCKNSEQLVNWTNN